VDVEERERQDAWTPVVSYHYENGEQYAEAEVEAADYCADRFYTDVRPAGDHVGTGGEATFFCVSK
jgi:hypothetical protein